MKFKVSQGLSSLVHGALKRSVRDKSLRQAKPAWRSSTRACGHTSLRERGKTSQQEEEQVSLLLEVNKNRLI